ncbi:efflux RND transporter periplasmic adaptor subunit [Methylobacterium sp. DB0501]|nr:efflux RND transporter periplasmic adaptor subunit [Methylobacterium sp. DB0501]NGM36100.1 efflux RND transporter periplasmic adaptor subunit [Methylobacterium sp. DB0501]
MRRAVLSAVLALCTGGSLIEPALSQGRTRLLAEGGRVAVRLTPEERGRIGVATAHLAPQPHKVEILAYGSVLDPARITDLTNSYAGAVAALRTARARAEVSAGALRRARSLGPTVVAGAQLETVEGSVHTDEAAVAAAESQVRTLAATAQQEWGPVLGRAIVERAPLVTRLIERADLLVQVTLPSGEALRAPPATAFAEVPPQSERVTMRLVSPATRADQRIQGVSYYYLVAGDGGLLPGMSVQAFLTSPQESVGIAVPESAVVHWQGRAWIYRGVGDETFARHPLKPDAPISADRYVVDDLGGEADVVVTGPQAVLTEELKGQVQASGDADDD